MSNQTVLIAALIETNRAGSAPANLSLPGISGTIEPGNTVTASVGSWSGTPTSYTYQWQLDGVDIGGETAATYAVLITDAGHSLRPVVTAHNAAGDSSPTNGNATTVPYVPYLQASSGWNIVFQDEFSGSLVDLAKWRPNWLAGSDGATTKPPNSAELAYINPSQATVSGGKLILKAEACSPVTINSVTYDFVSGLIESHSKFDATYGFFEARMQMPADVLNRVWPAFWLDGSGLNWPYTGEIDIVEAYGTDASCSYHYHYDSGGGVDGNHGGNSTVTGSTAGWHTYGAKWSPGNIKWYYDGVEVHSFSTGIVTTNMFIILNLGVKNAAIAVPKELWVDYVRAWQGGS